MSDEIQSRRAIVAETSYWETRSQGRVAVEDEMFRVILPLLSMEMAGSVRSEGTHFLGVKSSGGGRVQKRSTIDFPSALASVGDRMIPNVGNSVKGAAAWIELRAAGKHRICLGHFLSPLRSLSSRYPSLGHLSSFDPLSLPRIDLHSIHTHTRTRTRKRYTCGWSTMVGPNLFLHGPRASFHDDDISGRRNGDRDIVPLGKIVDTRSSVWSLLLKVTVYWLTVSFS